MEQVCSQDEDSEPFEDGAVRVVDAVSLAPWVEADDYPSADTESSADDDLSAPDEGAAELWRNLTCEGDGVANCCEPWCSVRTEQPQGGETSPASVTALPTTASRGAQSAQSTPKATSEGSRPPVSMVGTLSNVFFGSSGGQSSPSKSSPLSPRSLMPRSPATHALIDDTVSIQNLDLLRGAELCKVMHGLGYLFDSSHGSDRTYALSEPVSAGDGGIDFISHNWSTGRFLKFSTLALHYNSKGAVHAALLTAAILGTLTASGVLPVHDKHPDYPWSGIVSLGSVAVFLIFLCFGHETHYLSLWCGSRKKKNAKRNLVFFDKVCIHQTDPAIQKEGIQNLAGFLRESRHILVVYSSLYLRRLWTVYELASFLMLRREEAGITLLPVSWTMNCLSVFIVCLTGQLLTYGYFFVGEASHTFVQRGQENDGLSRPAPLLINFFSSLFLFTLVTYLTHRWQRHRKSVEHAIQNFSVRSVSCKEEADRVLVTGNICTFLRCTQQVPDAASDDEALDEFDRVVREELPHVLAASVGEQVFPFQRTLLGTLPLLLGALDTVAAGLQTGDPPAKQLARSAFHITRAVFYVPLSFYCIHRLFAWVSPTGCKVPLLCFLAPYPAVLVFSPPNWMLVILHESWSGATFEWGLLGGLIFYCAFVAACTTCLYRKDPIVRQFLLLLRCRTHGLDPEEWAEGAVQPPPSQPCEVQVQDI